MLIGTLGRPLMHLITNIKLAIETSRKYNENIVFTYGGVRTLILPTSSIFQVKMKILKGLRQKDKSRILFDEMRCETTTLEVIKERDRRKISELTYWIHPHLSRYEMVCFLVFLLPLFEYVDEDYQKEELLVKLKHYVHPEKEDDLINIIRELIIHLEASSGIPEELNRRVQILLENVTDNINITHTGGE